MDELPSRFWFKVGSTGLRRFRNWLVVFAVGAIFVTFCYYWIDRPIAFWVHAHQTHFVTRGEFNQIVSIPNPAILVASVLFFLLGFSQLTVQPFKHLERVALVSSISLLVGETIKDVLKWVFGRPSPDIWAMSNSSAVGSLEYQFHWFHGVEPFNSFPSGHMTAATAVVAILWIHYPQFRPIYAVCCAIVAAGLIALNFHFLGDVIAGALLGATVGLLVSHTLLQDKTGGGL